MTKRETRRYSILIVSRKDSSIRKLEVSHRFLGGVIVVSIAFLVSLALSFSGLIHYRGAYLETEGVRLEAAKYRQESASLLSKLNSLEDTVGRTMRFAAKIDSMLDGEDRYQTGEGPIAEEDWLPVVGKSDRNQSITDRIWRSPFKESYTAKLDFKLDKLLAMASNAEEKVNTVFVLQQDRLFYWASLPSIWPTRGWVTSEFGDMRGYGRRASGGHHIGRMHEGIDIAAPKGTPVMATGDGFVTYAGYRNGYGNTLIIDHGNGITTVYAHCSALFVGEGSRVSRGMIIAAVGNTGRSTGPHLHYEVRVDDLPVNPMQYIVDM
jgi:murein DD-endopeptidase MepM/ murein hydrolase activator NlpD